VVSVAGAYIAFRVTASCPGCSAALLVDGPVRQSRCDGCGAERAWSTDLWRRVFDAGRRQQGTLDPGKTVVETIDAGNLELSLEIAVRQPFCHRCGVPLPVREMTIGSRQDIQCFKCGRPHATAPAPRWLRDAVPSAGQLYAAELDTGAPRLKLFEPRELARDGSHWWFVRLLSVPNRARRLVGTCPRCGAAGWSPLRGCVACQVAPSRAVVRALVFSTFGGLLAAAATIGLSMALGPPATVWRPAWGQVALVTGGSLATGLSLAVLLAPKRPVADRFGRVRARRSRWRLIVAVVLGCAGVVACAAAIALRHLAPA